MLMENVGYTIIKIISVSDCHYVLGYNHRNTYTPYVTWEMHGTRDNPSFNHGHYGLNKKDMELDLLKRCMKHMLIWDFPEIDIENLKLEDFLF